MTRLVTWLRALARRHLGVSRRELARFAEALRGPDRLSTCRAAVDGTVVLATLERRGLGPLLRDRPDLPDADPDCARRIAVAVDAGLGILPVQATCLRRSVTLLRELQRRDMRADLHIGVRLGPDGTEAHAWVQVADHVVNDDPGLVVTYTELAIGDAIPVLRKLR